MKRYILFTNPTSVVMSQITSLLFPKEFENKVLAYMPCNGLANTEQEQQYTNFWVQLAKESNTQFLCIDNSKLDATEEVKKLETANILLITGGNTFTLLHNIRQNRLDQAIKEFARKDNFVIAGWSAGALILTPSIALSTSDNDFGITDLAGLSLVNFEVMPHYNPSKKAKLDEYMQTTSNNVKTIEENQYILL